MDAERRLGDLFAGELDDDAVLALHGRYVHARVGQVPVVVEVHFALQGCKQKHVTHMKVVRRGSATTKPKSMRRARIGILRRTTRSVHHFEVIKENVSQNQS